MTVVGAHLSKSFKRSNMACPILSAQSKQAVKLTFLRFNDLIKFFAIFFILLPPGVYFNVSATPAGYGYYTSFSLRLYTFS